MGRAGLEPATNAPSQGMARRQIEGVNHRADGVYDLLSLISSRGCLAGRLRSNRPETPERDLNMGFCVTLLNESLAIDLEAKVA